MAGLILQLDPMIPVYVPRFDMEGFAFIATRYSQEHYIVFTIALDNGEIWELDNRYVRFCKNVTVDRESKIDFGKLRNDGTHADNRDRSA